MSRSNKLRETAHEVLAQVRVTLYQRERDRLAKIIDELHKETWREAYWDGLMVGVVGGLAAVLATIYLWKG